MLVLLATVAAGAAALPSRVHLYYTPTDQPDVVYERWQYLLLVVVGAPLIALLIAKIGSAIYEFVMELLNLRPRTVARVGARLAAWTFLWYSSVVWSTMWLGNDQPLRRSSLELLSIFLAFLGAALIVAWHIWCAARRTKSRQQRKTRSA